MTLTPAQRHSFAEDLRDIADMVERGDVSSAAVTYIGADGDDIQCWIMDGQVASLVGATEMLKAMIIDFELTSQAIDDLEGDGDEEDDA